MVDAVRLAPRLWDGQRLLRFLAGLAMLALAFAAHAGLTGPAAVPAPAAAVVSSAPTPIGAADAPTEHVAVTVSDVVRPGAVAELAGGVVAGEPAAAPQTAELSGSGTRGPPLR